MIAGLTADNDRASDRLAGVHDAAMILSDSRVSLAVTESAYSYAEGGKAAARLLSALVQPTVLVCGNDILAVGAIKQLKKMGLGVPQDISVTGFDDIEIATIVEPALTTVHVPHGEMGGLAAQTLLQMLSDGHDIAAGHELKPMIVERESLARVAVSKTC